MIGVEHFTIVSVSTLHIKNEVPARCFCAGTNVKKGMTRLWQQKRHCINFAEIKALHTT
jgi:hypothetical protein